VSLKKELTKLSSVVGRGQREIDRERDTATERERRTAQSTNIINQSLLNSNIDPYFKQ